MEHGFAEESLAQGNTVEPTHQLSSKPTFDGMSISQTVQIDIGLLHLFGNPCTILRCARYHSAGLNDLVKRMIERDLKNCFFEGLTQASRNCEVLEFENQPRVR